MISDEMIDGVRKANEKTLEYLKGGDTTHAMARLAVAYISAFVKLRTTENANRALQCAVISQVASSKEELKDFLNIAQPGLIPAKSRQGLAPHPDKNLLVNRRAGRPRKELPA